MPNLARISQLTVWRLVQESVKCEVPKIWSGDRLLNHHEIDKVGQIRGFQAIATHSSDDFLMQA